MIVVRADATPQAGARIAALSTSPAHGRRNSPPRPRVPSANPSLPTFVDQGEQGADIRHGVVDGEPIIRHSPARSPNHLGYG
jgi:hypothetical protein